ncbi:MAG TPA: polysaccharide deacetylase family protein [Terriglobia bacterium]|nr:polysaccharide deacetylase family protein [Terriglobia bacterium]
MRKHRVVGFSLIAAMMIASLPAAAQTKSVAERLGYPAGSKLLIIHADDLAVAHSVDEASFAALESGAVSSASVMVPCPWLTEVADWFRAHPDADLGLHLTLTSEWKTYRWGPVAPADQVPTLVNPRGYFWPDVAPVTSRATSEDVEREIRAQVERALSMGIHPTHLDTHMGTLLARAGYYAALVKVAHEYHLPFMAARPPLAPPNLAALLAPNDVLLDSVVIFGPGVPPDRWTETYIERLKALKPGLNEMIVHLGHDDAELEAITVGHPDYGAAWRGRDFKAMTSPEFRQALTDNHIILVHWKDLKALL